MTLYDIPLQQIDGSATTLRPFHGKVLLIVNVASKCGLTPQYAALEQLFQSRRAAGLAVLGFPANDFGGQEPGTDAQIREFCSTHYSVHFPLFSKISVTGTGRHALYSHLIAAQPVAMEAAAMREKLAAHGIQCGAGADVLWNFEKFLVSRAGAVVARFAPAIAPDDSRLLAMLDSELSRNA